MMMYDKLPGGRLGGANLANDPQVIELVRSPFGSWNGLVSIRL